MHNAETELGGNQSANDLKCLSLSEAAHLLRVSPMTLRRLIKTGVLPAVRVGGQLRIIEQELRRFIESSPGS